jgi:hypothetical protein
MFYLTLMFSRDDSIGEPWELGSDNWETTPNETNGMKQELPLTAIAVGR